MADRPVTARTARSWIRNIARGILGGFLIFAGTAHLTFARVAFQSLVPNWVPLNANFVVVASGVVEIILGVSVLILYRWRVPIGWIIAAFFVAVFPGNISQYVTPRRNVGAAFDHRLHRDSPERRNRALGVNRDSKARRRATGDQLEILHLCVFR